MKFFNLFVIFSAVCLNLQAADIETITPEQLHAMLANNEVALVDVRSTDEFVEEHIAGAISLPLQIVDRQGLNAGDKKLVVQCKSGKRGAKAYAKLKAQTPSLNIANLEGGINAWKSANLPTESIKSTLPIARQTQIAAGSIIALGVLFGMFFKIFLIIPLFVGCGLIMAGITGWCGLAELISKLPWNL